MMAKHSGVQRTVGAQGRVQVRVVVSNAEFVGERCRDRKHGNGEHALPIDANLAGFRIASQSGTGEPSLPGNGCGIARSKCQHGFERGLRFWQKGLARCKTQHGQLNSPRHPPRRPILALYPGVPVLHRNVTRLNEAPLAASCDGEAQLV